MCEYPEDIDKDEGVDEVDKLKEELERKTKELTEKSEGLTCDGFRWLLLVGNSAV